MADPNSDDWLPPGWTVKLRIRKNGKRDKYYFAPSGGLKFNSRLEVSRYLDKSQNNKVSLKRIAKDVCQQNLLLVVVEKDIAEGLPPGWIKKTRITKKGATIRRDSYYIDPVSGYVFRSIKDANRYLESGKIGRNAFKPKDNDSSNLELEDDKLSSAGVPKKPKFAVSKVRQQIIMDQPPNLNEQGNDIQIIDPACADAVGNKLKSSVVSQAEGFDQKEERIGSAESTFTPGSVDGFASQKQLPQSEQTTHEIEKAQNGQCKRKQKKEINLPRRASKRLAGIKVDPVPELKTNNRARRIAVKQSGEEEAITNENKSPGTGSLPNGVAKQFNVLEGGSENKWKFDNSTDMVETPKSGRGKHSYNNLSTPEKLPENTVEEHQRDKNQDCLLFLPLEKQATVKEHVRDFENGDKVDLKLDHSLDLPLGEFLTDPCIAFAIQTLTGTTFESSKNTQISSELNNSNHSENLAAAEGQNVEKQGCNMFSSAENLVISKEHAGDAEIDDKARENSGSSSEMALGVSWMDPCIEFAIKTLTGSIPLDYDPNTENCLQQQLGSSNSGGHCEMALSSVSLDNLCQTDYYCSQYFGMQKPVFKQPSFVDPAIPNTINFSIGSSAGARLPQCGEDKWNGCQR